MIHAFEGFGEIVGWCLGASLLVCGWRGKLTYKIDEELSSVDRLAFCSLYNQKSKFTKKKWKEKCWKRSEASTVTIWTREQVEDTLITILVNVDLTESLKQKLDRLQDEK